MGKKFLWNDFVHPSTLQLSSFIELLLEPIEIHESIFKVQLGLHEALVNAVKHGNESDPNKSLRVRRILTPNWVVFQIQDQGEGLPFGERTNNLPEEPEENSGRGLYIIHSCFDDIRWSFKGNRIQIASRRIEKPTFLGN